MKSTTNFKSFKMDFQAGYFADEPPFEIEVLANSIIRYSRFNPRNEEDSFAGEWEISKEDKEKLLVLLNQLFEFEIKDDETVCDGGSTSFELTLMDGSKKSIDRSHHANVPRPFINLEHEIEILLVDTHIERPTDLKFITISTTSCYGQCPVYEIEIDPLGQVFYIGKDWVAVSGVESWNLPIRELKEVNRIAQEIYDTELTLNEGDEPITDMPSFKIKFSNGIKSNEADFYLQDCDGMEELEDNISYLNNLIGVTDLINDESIIEEE